MNNLLWIILGILIVQRVSEYPIARKNEMHMKANGAREFDKSGYRVIVLMHIGFFISLVLEYILLYGKLNKFWIPLLILFILAQFLRYWAIGTLGRYWNTKILVIPETMPINRGPYKYMKHPNYIAVITEIAVIPLIFSCYLTAVVFSILNILVLRRRIKIEEKALSGATTDPQL